VLAVCGKKNPPDGNISRILQSTRFVNAEAYFQINLNKKTKLNKPDPALSLTAYLSNEIKKDN
jgi:hypothetical protein